MSDPIRGRGAQSQVKNRFETTSLELDHLDEQTDDTSQRVATQYFDDDSRSIVSENNSPDIPFRYSLNPYRGCEHGCSYCYARPTHEYLGMSAGLDFETKIIIKNHAVDLLRNVISRPSWQPQSLMMSGVTDPYQPIERQKKITRRLLALLAEYRHPVSIITKNALIERDVDLLGQMASDSLAGVAISLTTLDAELARTLEPRTSSPEARLRAIRTLSDAGVPVRVMTAPVIAGLNDHEIPGLLAAASQAGATSAGYVMLRLPGAVEPVFRNWLATVRPDIEQKVLAKVRETRGGAMNDYRFGQRMRGSGVRADSIADIFRTFSKKYGMTRKPRPLCCDLFRPPGGSDGQLQLF